MIRAAATRLLLLAGIAVPAAAAVPPVPPAPKEPPPQEAPPASHEHIRKNEATGILGKEVTDQKGDGVGRIVNVLVDQDGNPRAVVIDFGGWLGVGSRKIAVAWRALHFSPAKGGNRQITLDMTPDQLKNTPEYTGPSQPVTIAAPPRPGEPPPQPAGPR